MKKNQVRSDKVVDSYFEHKKECKDDKCYFCFSDSVKTFVFWKLKKNMFPYDMIAEEHMLLSPYEHVANREHLMPAAKIELEEILKKLDDEKYFDMHFENFKNNRTIVDHFHIHLIKYKEKMF